MVNYANDTENEDDYEIGWEWCEVDPGPMIAPYTGFRQCLLDPTKNRPEDFFNALFDEQMYTIMAEQTNKYAHRKIQRGKLIFQIFIYFLSECFLNPELCLTRSDTHHVITQFTKNCTQKQKQQNSCENKKIGNTCLQQ